MMSMTTIPRSSLQSFDMPLTTVIFMNESSVRTNGSCSHCIFSPLRMGNTD